MSQAWRHWFTPHHSNRHHARVLHPDGLFLVGISILLLHIGIGFLVRHGVFTNVLGYSSDITTAKVLTATNSQRESAGLKPLKTNGKLNAAAQAKANDMISQQYWSHTSPTGKSPWSFVKSSGYTYTVAGENLARNFGDTDGMVNAWLASPTHRENLLSDRYTETGIAVVNGTMQGVETTLVVQMFAAPKAVAAAPPPSPVTSPAPAPTSIPTPVPEPVVEEIITASADETANAPVLGDRASAWTLTPSMLYRFGLSAISAFLIALLIHDGFGKKKKHHLFGKNFAHVLLLFGVAATIWFAERGGILL